MKGKQTHIHSLLPHHQDNLRRGQKGQRGGKQTTKEANSSSSSSDKMKKMKRKGHWQKLNQIY